MRRGVPSASFATYPDRNCDRRSASPCDTGRAKVLAAPANVSGDACSGITSRTAGPGTAARSRPVQPYVATEPRNEAIYVIVGGWHTELALPMPAISVRLAALKLGFGNARYLVFGWGARDYYMSRDPELGDLLRATRHGPSQQAEKAQHREQFRRARAEHGRGLTSGFLPLLQPKRRTRKPPILPVLAQCRSHRPLRGSLVSRKIGVIVGA